MGFPQTGRAIFLPMSYLAVSNLPDAFTLFQLPWKQGTHFFSLYGRR